MTLAFRMRLARRALLLLALPALAAAQLSPADEASPEPPVYRLELIVFEYPEGRSDARAAPDPLDYTRLPDPRLLSAAQRAVRQHLATLRVALPMLPDPEDITRRGWLENEDERIEPAPDPYLAGVALSAPMQLALARLEQSPDHLPVIALAWVQPAERGRRTPTLRVHDDRIVERIEPVAPPTGFFFPDPKPIERALTEAATITARLAPGIASPGGSPTASEAMIGNRTTGETGIIREIPGLPRPPPARPVYRIDGGVQLFRGQFFRLWLDLVLQQPAEPARLPGAPARPADEAAWSLHRLDQTRAIRPDRFEYFDSSRFGVLARLTRFEHILPEPEPEAPVDRDDGKDSEPDGEPIDRSGASAAMLSGLHPDRSSFNAIGHD